MKKRTTINQVIAYIESLKESGQKEIEVDLRAVRGLRASASAKRRAAPRKPIMAREASPPPGGRTVTVATADGLAAIAQRIRACRSCRLCETRTNTVPGQGNPQPELMFIGEGPGADEDEQGLAFVGRAGQLLTKIIEAMGFTRDDVFIGNIVKCRPPDNRVPEPDEMATCIPYLKEQIALLKPTVIVCLGATAVKGLFGDKVPGITKLRGTWMEFEGIEVMPTLHPAYLLRNPPAKKDVWTDMQAVVKRLGRTLPKK
ncbi:MAG TPA: uracil-DNA glycosylase [Kiritimatiellia bacterium]|nr:uracil-DNA glycosylase [Kiritimatiellia bacterium]HMP33393.1 uracil-DNA glycosylase [Kiritimatiellia bacterium]